MHQQMNISHQYNFHLYCYQIILTAADTNMMKLLLTLPLDAGRREGGKERREGKEGGWRTLPLDAENHLNQADE